MSERAYNKIAEGLNEVLDAVKDETLCRHCGGPKAIRNPTRKCDHLYWPDYLTDEAKRANGYQEVMTTMWVQK